jgi:hypothetical protein
MADDTRGRFRERIRSLIASGSEGRHAAPVIRRADVETVRHSHLPAMPDGNGCQAAYQSSLLDARGAQALFDLVSLGAPYLLVRRWLSARAAARVGAGSCRLVGGDGTLAQQIGVRAARGGGLPALAPP